MTDITAYHDCRTDLVAVDETRVRAFLTGTQMRFNDPGDEAVDRVIDRYGHRIDDVLYIARGTLLDWVGFCAHEPGELTDMMRGIIVDLMA